MNVGVERYEEKRRRKGKKFKLILPVLFFILLGGTVINPAMCKNSFADTINLGNANVVSGLLNSEQAQLKKVGSQLTNKKIFKSPLSEYVVGKKQLSTITPVGGSGIPTCIKTPHRYLASRSADIRVISPYHNSRNQ